MKHDLRSTGTAEAGRLGPLCRDAVHSASRADALGICMGQRPTLMVKMRCLATLAALCFLLASPAVSRAADNADLIGTWVWQMPRPACSITRTFSADGTVKVLNGQKNTTGTYSVRQNRERTARQLIYTVATDDGGTDCDGTKRSTVGTRYLVFLDISGSSMRLCVDSSKSGCMGPYRKR